MRRPFSFTIIALSIAAIVAAGVLWLRDSYAPKPAGPSGGVVSAVPLGGPFTLSDHTGKRVSDADFRGKFALIYFGYTFCPDVCPTELGQMAAAIDLLGADGAAVTPVFITIDPERDTQAVLAKYVPLFHERMVGLTGTPEQIRAVAQAYRMFYQKVVDKDYSDYLMDHSSFVYLLGPDGKVVTLFRYGTAAEDMAAGIRAQLHDAR